MRKSIRLKSVLLILAIIAFCFFMLFRFLSAELAVKNSQYKDAQARLTDINNKNSELQSLLEKTTDDDFVQYIARTKYGYMLPSELRMVITNKEALYGEEDPMEQ